MSQIELVLSGIKQSKGITTVAARGLDTAVAVFAKRKGSKNRTNLLAGEQGVMFNGVLMDSFNKKERSLADIEDTFYKTMSANTVFSSVNRSASALENLTKTTAELAEEMGNLREAFEESSNSSSKVAGALNWLTGALVLVGVAQVVVAVIK
jgi:hypothetical protein